MKMVRSLLLGTAAGFVAIAGAQAADLPVKAKPVQYVKICDLYGAGYYYIPGTDTCIKLGGYVRADYGWNDADRGAEAFPTISGTYTRGVDGSGSWAGSTWRARGVLTADVRSQTAYGTLRSYISVGANSTSPGGGVGLQFDRAFIQFAGFTFGLAATSFWDMYGVTGPYEYLVHFSSNGKGATGQRLIAYTAQFGNGVSASLSLEDPTTRSTGVFDAGAGLAARTAGFTWPDIVANLRVDQAWGYAGVSGVLHRVAATYYGGAVVLGSPSDELGYAIQGSFQLNVPGLPGDTLGATVAWSRGATQYASNGYIAGPFGFPSNSQVFWGFVSDGVFCTASALCAANTGIQMTEVFNVSAGYNHMWSPTLQTNIGGGYTSFNYNGTVAAWSAASGLCAGGVVVTGTCNPDFNVWSIGSRTQWTPVANLNIGIDVLYTYVDTAAAGTTAVFTPAPRPTATYAFADEGVWSAMLRVQRNFWP